MKGNAEDLKNSLPAVNFESTQKPSQGIYVKH